MLVKEFIQRVQSLYSKGVQSDDTRLSSRHIYHIGKTLRTKLFRQQINAKQKVSQWNYQSLNCIKMVEVQEAQCPCVKPVGCKIYRSKYKIPSLITSKNKHAIQSLTSIENSLEFNETTLLAKKYSKGRKYTSSKPEFFIDEDYIYLTTKKAPKIVSLIALFEDPIEAQDFIQLCEGENPDCRSYLDYDFPISGQDLDVLVQLTFKELNIFLQIKEDTKNDSQDRSEIQTKQS